MFSFYVLIGCFSLEKCIQIDCVASFILGKAFSYILGIRLDTVTDTIILEVYCS